MVTAPGEQAGPTPQMVPVPETADRAVVKESVTLEPAGLRLNCHSHRPSSLLLGERREWPQPTVVRSTSEASSETRDRKSTRLNSSHVKISYAVFCLKKKKNK